MINLLYYSHTIVPAHLDELVTLDLIKEHEQVLVALDGVLQHSNGRRLGGATLHDYCLITTMRVLLWARDYNRHVCYAFPLTDVRGVEGVGIDPLHANLRLTFAVPDSEDQCYQLTLLPVADLTVAIALLRLAADASQEMALRGIPPQNAAHEITAILSAAVFKSAPVQALPDAGLRQRGAEQPFPLVGTSPATGFQTDPSNLPPEQIYAAGRVARSAWDTLRRSLREAALPFDLSNGGNLRDLTDTLRAANELLVTVSSNPGAREMAMAFLDRRSGKSESKPARPGTPAKAPPSDETMDTPDESQQSRVSDYREIPLRRRAQSHSENDPDALRLQSIPLRRRRVGGKDSVHGNSTGDAC